MLGLVVENNVTPNVTNYFSCYHNMCCALCLFIDIICISWGYIWRSFSTVFHFIIESNESFRARLKNILSENHSTVSLNIFIVECTAHHIFIPQGVQGLVTLPFICNCCVLFHPILMDGLFCTLSWLYFVFSDNICSSPARSKTYYEIMMVCIFLHRAVFCTVRKPW